MLISRSDVAPRLLTRSATCSPVIQESAAYAAVSVRQSRQLANTFEVAVIGLTWVAT